MHQAQGVVARALQSQRVPEQQLAQTHLHSETSCHRKLNNWSFLWKTTSRISEHFLNEVQGRLSPGCAAKLIWPFEPQTQCVACRHVCVFLAIASPTWHRRLRAKRQKGKDLNLIRRHKNKLLPEERLSFTTYQHKVLPQGNRSATKENAMGKLS